MFVKKLQMPRQTRLRKVVAPPRFKGYKPYGSTKGTKGFIELYYEEYEAIKLADYDLMNHKEAAELMDVSRATFARIYESARRKIAKAFVKSKEIRTVFGNAKLDGEWYVCDNCNARFTVPEEMHKDSCPMCRSEKVSLLDSSNQ